MKIRCSKLKMRNKWKKNLNLNKSYQTNNCKNKLTKFKIRWTIHNKISNSLRVNNNYPNKINSSNPNNSNMSLSFRTLVKSVF